MSSLPIIGPTLFGQAPSVQQAPTNLQQFPTMSPEQQALLGQYAGYLGGVVGQPGTAYGGQMVAGMSPMQQATMGGFGRYAGAGFSPEEYFQQTYAEPLTREWRETIMPEIGGEFGRRGLFMGSGRREAELESAGALTRALGQGALATRQAGLQEMLGLTGMGMQLGGVERGIEQQGLQATYNEFLRTQPGAQPEMQQALALLGISPYTTPGATTQPVVTPGQPGLLQQALQGAGPIMMGMGAMGWNPFSGGGGMPNFGYMGTY